MRDFCADDPRLMGVGAVPTHDIDEAIAELDWVLDAGLDAVWVPHGLVAQRSPGHVDLYPFWARLAESATPFVLHIGGAPLQLDPGWANTGRAAARDWMGGGGERTQQGHGGAAPGTRDVPVDVGDGRGLRAVPRFARRQRGAGGGWVPAMLERLDMVVRSWSRVDQYLAELDRTPTETLRAQMAFTPFVFEDVGALIDRSHDDLYLFSSDYPHVEGGKDPIGRFEASLGDRPAQVRDRFYAENFCRIWPVAGGV